MSVKGKKERKIPGEKRKHPLNVQNKETMKETKKQKEKRKFEKIFKFIKEKEKC